MNPILTADDLFQAQQGPLKLRWLGGRGGRERLLEPATARFPGMALVGHLNFVHPNRVQVLGAAEVDYLRRLPEAEHAQAVQNLFTCATTTIVVVTSDENADADFIQAADAAGLPLFATPLPSPKIIDHLQHYLTRALAVRTTLHGVFLEVMGLGIFITGDSGIGKSEVALELLSRGHRLIADDATEFARTAPDVLLGRCPRMLCDFLEVRGLGILNVRAMFGDIAVRPEKTLRLIVHLEPLTPERMARIDRLQAEQKTRTILDVDIPEVVLYVAPGRNLAVLVEAATRSHILRMRGINPVEELMQRQQICMIGNPP
ncbi:MAG: HPr(Ser) kinase/phosphatase [Gammaproteobacteria bacterium]|nr:HPr(Ser) kinase/phosphatase [Gammaproteobacteria bacterium]